MQTNGSVEPLSLRAAKTSASCCKEVDPKESATFRAMTKRPGLLRRILRRLAMIFLSLIVLSVLIEIGLRLFTELGVAALVKD